MSHQPYETWILDHDARLTPENRRTLHEHLEGCSQCRRLQHRWQLVHQELRSRPMAAPAPGFAQRWHASLAERRAREQRKQAWKIFGMLLGGALFMLLMLGVYVLSISSPADWLVSLARTVVTSREFLFLAIHAVHTWLTSTPLAINLALWIYLTVAFSLIALFWVFIVWRTNIVGVLNR